MILINQNKATIPMTEALGIIGRRRIANLINNGGVSPIPQVKMPEMIKVRHQFSLLFSAVQES
jgi:hypothetical protein